MTCSTPGTAARTCPGLDEPGLCWSTCPENTQKIDRQTQTALPVEADFVWDAGRQWHMRCHSVSGRKGIIMSSVLWPKQFLTWRKTAPHLGMGWLFELRMIFAVLTCISRANYCNDYFKCTVHFSSASLFCRLLGQTCLDRPLVGKMWVPHIVATPVSSFSGAHRECWSRR